MIEQTRTANTAPAPQTQKVLRKVKNERMGGSATTWGTIEFTPQSAVEKNLAQTQNGLMEFQSFETTLAYQQVDTPNPEDTGEDYGFGDLIDMVTPLHHIPLVGHTYRTITDSVL